MRDEHIIKLLDKVPLGEMSESELSRIEEHTGHCSRCQRAFQAAQITTLLLRERTASAVEPSSFFTTRLMAAVREKQAGQEPVSFLRVWKSAGLLVYSLAALVILLTALTVFQSDIQPQEEPADPAAGLTTDLTDWVVYGGDSLANSEMTYGQVLTDIYFSGSESEGGDGKKQ